MPRNAWISEIDKRSGTAQEENPPKIPDRDRRIQAALKGERGASWGERRLFQWYEGGLIFLRGPIEDFEIEAMLRTDGKARAVEQVLTLPVRGARHEIEIGGATPEVQRYCEGLLLKPPDQGGMKTPLHEVIAQTAMATLYRAACFEKVFTLDDAGMVVYDRVAYRPPTSCYLARSAKTAHLEGFLQWTWVGVADFRRIYIPRVKAFTYLHGLHRDPINGASDIEVAYRAFQTKQKLRFLWASWLENQVVSKLLAHVESGEEQQAADLAVKSASLKGGDAIGLTGGQSVTALDSNAEAGNSFAQAIAYLDEEIYSSILANFLGLATASGVRGGGGSYALSLSQTDFYLQSRWAVLVEIAEAITYQLLAPMVKWNFGSEAVVPSFKFVSLAPTSNTQEAIVQMVSSLLAATDQQGQPAAVPPEFVDELFVTASPMLGLNEGKVRTSAAEHRQKLASQGVQQNLPLHAAVDALHAQAPKAA